ncbi:MAG: hypothetical protein HYV97_18940 [Bdellovibrio sp.]|nr:hypothetical protein [Bdellovibrio sp.]
MMNSSRTIGRPLLVFAHKGEAQAFLAHFKASPLSLPSLSQIQLFECQQLLILLTGEGRIGASQKLSDVLNTLSKDIAKVINLGVAGALNQELSVGTVVLVDHIYAFDGPIVQCSPMKCSGPLVPCTTADLFTSDKRVLGASESLELAKLAPIVDREAHGLAQTTHLYNLPFTSLKVISDLPWQAPDNLDDGKYQKEVQKKATEWSTLLLKTFNRLS